MSAPGKQPTLTEPQTLVLECSICTEQYGLDFDRIPRSLRCGHTFCSKCLVKILMTKGVRCPICSLDHPLPMPDVTQIPVNYAVLEIIRNISAARDRPDDEDENTPCCQVCSKKNAQVACIDCQPGVKFLFCHPCDQQEHNRPFKPVQGHRRYPVDRVPNAMYVCSRHRDTEATLFSESLFEFACEKCKLATDWPLRSKLFDLIPVALKRLRSRSQKLNIYSLNVISQLKDAKHKMKVIIERLDPSASEAKQDIQTKFGAIMDLIQTRQRELLDYVENESVSRKQRLQEQLEQILVSLKMYRDAYEDLNTLISKSDLEFLLSYQVVTEKVEALLASEDKSLHRPAVTEEIPFFIAKDIEQQLRTLGAVGGGITPTELECVANSKGNMMQLNWQLPKSAGRVLHFQIEYEHLPDSSPFNRDSSQLDTVYVQGDPHLHQVTGNELSAFVDYLCPSYQYRFRIRSANAAGWGMWSKPVIGRCEDFPVIVQFTKKINRIRIPENGYYRVTAKGAKAADGKMHSGGRGAIISATFFLRAGDVLIILCGGMSLLQKFSTGGGGGTFVAVNEINQDNLLIAAGGGGGTRGMDDNDFDGSDACLEPSGRDGRGREHGKGGINSGPGEDANTPDYQTPCWGYGGAGFLQDSSTASSFLKGGHGGQCGGFGGGGAIGQYGGGGGGGYSGGGGGRGGGGGGSFVRSDGIDTRKEVGNDSNGSVMIEKVQHPPPYPSGVAVGVNRSDSSTTVSSGYSTQGHNSLLQTQFSQASSASATNDAKTLQSIRESMVGSKSPDEQPATRTPSSHGSPLNTLLHEPPVPGTNVMPVQEVMSRVLIDFDETGQGTLIPISTNTTATSVSSDGSNNASALIEQQQSQAVGSQLSYMPHSLAPAINPINKIHITQTNDRNSATAETNTLTEDRHQKWVAPPPQGTGVNPHYPPQQNQ